MESGKDGNAQQHNMNETKIQQLLLGYESAAFICLPLYGEFHDLLGVLGAGRLFLAHQVAGSDAHVLITGEQGTEKELIAETIHINSKRKGRSFIRFNAAAGIEERIEHELFGESRSMLYAP